MANNGLNSFAENMRIVLVNQANQLSLLTAMQKSMVENNTYSVYEWNDEDSTYHEFQLPTFAALQSKITNIENSIQSLLTGTGSIETDDGNRFHITIRTVPMAPDNISYLEDPVMFYTDPNWVFEDYMFPAAKVRIMLTGQIEDKCQQIYYKRVIVDSSKATALVLWNNRLKSYKYTYPELVNILIDNGISYYEDTQTVAIPHARNTYWGAFLINDDPFYDDNNQIWYTFDSLEYSTIDRNGTDQGSNNLLVVGDNLTYNNALFEILEINSETSQVRLRCINGVAFPGNGSMLQYYSDATRDKYVDIRFGAHEYNFVYLKAVSPETNIVSNTWSQCIRFASDELSHIDNEDTKFLSYYENNIYDWGAKILADVKEKHVPAYMGVKPNVPSLQGANLEVVEINTHLTNESDLIQFEQYASELERAKSHIEAITLTLNQLRSTLLKTTSIDEYKNIQDSINENIQNLQSAQSTYTSIANQLKNDNDMQSLESYAPKFRIRGFFPIPAPVYYDSEHLHEQEVIGFDIAYRYLSQKKQSNKLQQYEYTDIDNSKMDAVFSDWNIVQSKILDRVYNSKTDVFEWKRESVSDGSTININQIDIPITLGECVEIKIRSITEAGYPENPVKSDWSNTVTVEFPDSLKTSNTFADAVEAIKDEINDAAFKDYLVLQGVTAHMQDSIKATDGTEVVFHHQSKNLAYEDIVNDTVTVTNLQSKISTLDNKVYRLENQYQQLVQSVQNMGTNLKSTSNALNKLNDSLEQANTTLNNAAGKASSSDLTLSARDAQPYFTAFTNNGPAELGSLTSTILSDNSQPISNKVSTYSAATMAETILGKSSILHPNIMSGISSLQQALKNVDTFDSNVASEGLTNKASNIIKTIGGGAVIGSKGISTRIPGNLQSSGNSNVNNWVYGNTTMIMPNKNISGGLQQAIYNEEFIRRQYITTCECTKSDKDFEELEKKYVAVSKQLLIQLTNQETLLKQIDELKDILKSVHPEFFD